MKVYEFQWGSEKEWVAANTAGEAIRVYCETTSIDPMMDIDELESVLELPEAEWKALTILSDEGEPSRTLAAIMQDCTTPQYIAGTMYV